MREETILSPSQVSGYIKSWMDRDRLLLSLIHISEPTRP